MDTITNNIRAELTAEAKATIRKLKGANCMPEFRKEMGIATAPMVPAVRRAIRSIPSTRSRYKAEGGSLRNAVANSIQRKMKLTSRTVMVVIKSVPNGGKANLGSVLEGTTPWVHPTFGHAPIVDQKSYPEFFPTLNKMAFGVERNVKRVLDKFEREL